MIKILKEKIGTLPGVLILYSLVFGFIFFKEGINTKVFMMFSLYFMGVLFIVMYMKIRNKMGDELPDEDIDFKKNRFNVVGQAVEDIIHQWKQPLNVISSIASAVQLETEKDKCKTEELQRYMEDIINNVNYMSDTMVTFRDFLSQREEKLSLDIKREIEKSILILSNLIKNNNVQIKTNLDKVDNFSVDMSLGLLMQAIINIIVNANDVFTKRSISNPEILIFLHKSEDSFEIEIQDNAGGVESGNLGKIFDYNFSTKENKQGNGIGLFIVKKIVEGSFCGEISVQNTEKGASFLIKIPLI